MMHRYDFEAIEKKWRRRWAESQIYRTSESPRRKYYVLEMFAYPSGDIHMGHFRNYTIGDVVARHRMMCGYDVLHPFGWDAFGLPAEAAAIKNNLHPRDWTLANIRKSRATLQTMGISYDWDREVVTCDPAYYKWTQWLFLLLFKRGLAYQAPSIVNWCPKDRTILANEQCADGKCWRCGTEVEKKAVENCWFFRYSDYAQRLLDDLDRLPGWPENVKTMQRNWIGRSEGCELDFQGDARTLTVYTTRPDTAWGVTYLALAPEHPLARELAGSNPRVAEYVRKASKKSEMERTAAGEKDGVFTGREVTNPLNGESVPLWVADYVIASYGTGIVMGVPGHDTRDFAFAKKYGLPIRIVIQPPGEGLDAATLEDAWVGPGTMVQSGELDGTASPLGIPRVVQFVESRLAGRARVNFRLKDWLISRQRYWGCPIPIVHCAKCGAEPVPETDLPVRLPEGQIDFLPKARSPLADNLEFLRTRCPKCGGAALRDPDTMDTFMDSSFYLFRYCDPHNERAIWSRESANTWCPVDLYIGGITHAVMHLLYFRFITKVLYDAGYLSADEPATRLFNQGMVLDGVGVVMSKSLGNVVSPGDVLARWGVDVARIATFFAAPSNAELRWTEEGLFGAQRFVTRVWERVHNPAEDAGDTTALRRKLHQVIQRVTRSMEGDLHFHNCLAAIMELLNVAPGWPRDVGAAVVQLLSPMAPFLGEELWESLGNTGSVFRSSWPTFDPALAREDETEIVVQVNGKVRARFLAPAGVSDPELERQALELEAVRRSLDGKPPRKVIVVRSRLVSIVV